MKDIDSNSPSVGSRSWPRLIEALASVCKEHPVERKVLLLQNHHSGQLVLQSLAKCKGGWLNLRVATPLDLAWETVAAQASARGLTAADERSLEGAVIEAYLKAKRAFFPDKVPLGLLSAVGRALSELRMAGVTAEDVRSNKVVNPAKAKDLAAIMDEYTAALQRADMLDAAAVYRLAIGKSENRATVLLIPESLRLTGLSRQFVQSFRARRVVSISEDPVAGVVQPSTCFAKSAALPATPLSFIFSPAENTRGTTSIGIFSAAGARNEIREVFRRILERRIPFDEVEVILPDYAAYSVVLEDVAEEIGGIGLTFGSGLPAFRSGPARTLTAFAEWISNDLPEPTLRRMFSGGNIRPPEEVTRRQTARILRAAQIGWGKERYLTCLEAYCNEITERFGEAEDEEQKSQLNERLLWARKVATHVSKILDLIPGASEPLAAYFSAAAEFLERYGQARSESEGNVLKQLVKQLRASSSQASQVVPPRDVCLRLQAIADSVAVGASAPAPGYIHVVPLSAGGLSCRRHVFMLGLSEIVFPGISANEPILTDEERESLSDSLAVSAERVRERAFQFGEAFARIRGDLCLSVSTTDLLDGSRLFPSPLLLQALRLVSGNPRAGYDDLERALGAPMGFIPEKSPLGADEWWLSKIGDRGLLCDAQESVLDAFPGLHSGQIAAEKRQGPAACEYDGKLQRDRDFDLQRSRRPISATALESYAGCPRSFLFSHLLGIELPDELNMEPGRWLDPMQRGLLLHEFYRRFLAELKARKQQRDPEKHRKLAASTLDEVIAEWKALVPPPSDVVLESERAALQRSLGVFLREEKHVPPAGRGAPEYFEISFGLENEPETGIAEPVEIAFPGGKSILVRGRIDRIDRLAKPGAWAVWDYKTGRAKDYKPGEYSAGGTQLQHVLYASAAEEVLHKLGEKNPRVVVSGYLFPTERSEGNVCVTRDIRRKDEGLAIVKELLDAMAAGVFVGTGANCGRCDWATACYCDEKARWDQLVEDQDTSAAKVQRIQDYE